MGGSDLYTGTLDVLILKVLSRESMHGYAIGLWLRRVSGEVFNVQEGVLYPALHRLLRNRWVTAKWGTTETNRRAKFYSLTPTGLEHLDAQEAKLTEHSEAAAFLDALAPPTLATSSRQSYATRSVSTWRCARRSSSPKGLIPRKRCSPPSGPLATPTKSLPRVWQLIPTEIFE